MDNELVKCDTSERLPIGLYGRNFWGTPESSISILLLLRDADTAEDDLSSDDVGLLLLLLLLLRNVEIPI